MNKQDLTHAAALTLQIAKEQGATAADVGVSQSQGLSVNVRQGEVETLEHNNDKGLGLTVYFGQQKASASTADFSADAIADAVKAACDIAQHTEADDCAGLADADLMAQNLPDLSRYHPWQLDPEQAISLATECEAAGLAADTQISNSEGGSVSSHQGSSVSANSHGFVGYSEGTRHSISCSLIAEDAQGMQRDYGYTVARDPADLVSARDVGIEAATRTVKRLKAKPIKTGSYPIIFAADVAPALFRSFTSAISGGAIYRESSFLLDKVGEKIFPEFMRIHEQPHLLKGLGSANFDGEGVATIPRDWIQAGVLQGYILGSYSARKLGLITTGNAGGVRNLTIDAGSQYDLVSLLQEMGTGVLVTELMGMGVNIVTGDYSQGAAGFWVVKGEIQYAIDEFTIASNLREMFMGIQAVGTDMELRGNIRTGSVWIDRMQVAS